MRKIFVTGIGTGVGKTVVSAILTEALKADYWKPIQAGDLDNTDSMRVGMLISNNTSVIHTDTYQLKQPMSPHAAAAIDGININLDNITIPATDNSVIIIEGAGGLMVPLNSNDLMLDLICRLHAEVVLVSQNYLGSINHTLLSAEILKTKNIRVLGIVFNGERNDSTEKYILDYTGMKCLWRIKNEDKINKNMVLKYVNMFNFNFFI